MRINGVAEGVKQKKSLREYVKCSLSNSWSQVTRKKAEKSIINNHDIDLSISNFEKRHRCASMGWQRVSNEKKIARIRQVFVKLFLVTGHKQKKAEKSIINNHDIDWSISNFEKRHRCASMGWQRVSNEKKVCDNTSSVRWVMRGHMWWPVGNPPKIDKIDIIDRSVSIFKKIKKHHLDLLIIYLTKKNSSKSHEGLLRNGVVHVTMNRHTDRQTDRQRAWHDDFFQHVFSKKF